MRELPVTTRPAGTADAAAISAIAIELTQKYVLDECSADAAAALLGSLSPDRIEDNIRTGFHYYVAEIDTTMAGVIGLNPYQHVYHLFVLEQYQRQGIARTLWNVAKQAALADGQVETFTVNASPNARPVYEKLGFRAVAGPTERNGIITIPMQYTVLASESASESSRDRR